MKCTCLIFLFLFSIDIVYSSNSELLLQLDEEINNRYEYEITKEKELYLLEEMLGYTNSNNDKFQILSKLFDAIEIMILIYP